MNFDMKLYNYHESVEVLCDSTYESPLDTVKNLVASATKYDLYNNCTIDCKNINEPYDRIFKVLLPSIVDDAASQEKHVIALTISTVQTKILKYVLEAGFIFNQASPSEALLTKCLKGHSVEECNYPKYKTANIGVTGVVFNRALTHFVAIKEKEGIYKGFKAPTGTVDYEKGEDPLDTVVKELKEEANLTVDRQGALLVGNGWSDKFFRGKFPDINFVFAFCTDEESQQLKVQEDEIKEVTWLSVDDFLAMPLVNHDKPLILKKVVEVAREAIRQGQGWRLSALHWGSGRPVTFYGSSL